MYLCHLVYVFEEGKHTKQALDVIVAMSTPSKAKALPDHTLAIVKTADVVAGPRKGLGSTRREAQGRASAQLAFAIQDIQEDWLRDT